jgi:hypothetical protein
MNHDKTRFSTWKRIHRSIHRPCRDRRSFSDSVVEVVSLVQNVQDLMIESKHEVCVRQRHHVDQDPNRQVSFLRLRTRTTRITHRIYARQKFTIDLFFFGCFRRLYNTFHFTECIISSFDDFTDSYLK